MKKIFGEMAPFKFDLYFFRNFFMFLLFFIIACVSRLEHNDISLSSINNFHLFFGVLGVVISAFWLVDHGYKISEKGFLLTFSCIMFLYTSSILMIGTSDHHNYAWVMMMTYFCSLILVLFCMARYFCIFVVKDGTLEIINGKTYYAKEKYWLVPLAYYERKIIVK